MARYARVISVLAGSIIAVAGVAEPAAWAANPHAAKQHAAATSAQLPKGTAAAGQAQQGGETAGEADVLETSVTADGVAHVVSYTPAAGVTSDQLLANLAKAGKKGLSKSGGGTAQGSSAACTYYTWNTAKTTCPSVHWANNGYTRPQVYFVDHTGPQWPVPSATYTWNTAARIDSLYRWATCPGISGTHCVNLYDANYGATGWAGLTTWSYYTGNLNFVDGSVVIKFNDYYSYNSYGYLQDSCHEQGHALGLDHNSSTGSCLYYAIRNSSATTVPNSDDFNLLNWVYSTVH